MGIGIEVGINAQSVGMGAGGCERTFAVDIVAGRLGSILAPTLLLL
jgi:hypothetical protein